MVLAGCGESTTSLKTDQTSNDNQAAAMSPRGNISKARLMRIQTVLQEEVDAGIRAGFVAMVAKDGEIVYQTAVGMADRENRVPMAVDTRFRIASMTKAVTTVALMQLVEEGAVLLSDPASKYIPALADMQVVTSQSFKVDGTFETVPLKRPITLHHLLTHTAGFGYAGGGGAKTDLDKFYIDNNLYQTQKGDLATRVAHLMTLPLYDQPGDKYRYSYATDVVGRIVEVASGKPLEVYFQENIFRPLDMKDTEFFFDESDFNRLAVVYDVDENGSLIRAAGKYRAMLAPNDIAHGWLSGGGGLLSSARDYTRFFMMLLNEGELDGARLLSPVSISLMLQRNIATTAGFGASGTTYEAFGSTLGLGGYVLERPGLSGEMGAEGQWGWGGGLNTSAFLSPDNELAVIVMSQQISDGAPKSRAGRLVKAIAYGAIED